MVDARGLPLTLYFRNQHPRCQRLCYSYRLISRLSFFISNCGLVLSVSFMTSEGIVLNPFHFLFCWVHPDKFTHGSSR